MNLCERYLFIATLWFILFSSQSVVHECTIINIYPNNKNCSHQNVRVKIGKPVNLWFCEPSFLQHALCNFLILVCSFEIQARHCWCSLCSIFSQQTSISEELFLLAEASNSNRLVIPWFTWSIQTLFYPLRQTVLVWSNNSGPSIFN